MTEQGFFYTLIGLVLFFAILNLLLDLKNKKKIIETLAAMKLRVDNLWSQIERIDDQFKNVDHLLNVNDKNINLFRTELKKDILFWEKQRDEMVEKNRFDNNVFINRLNNHSKRIVYLKKVLDKLFDHKVEIKHKEKLLKLAGELEKW